jgi:hypothetical protein
MKRMIIGGFLMLFLASIIGCATIPVKPITQDDLPDLKGKWKGFYRDRITTTYVQPIELEIEDIEDFKVKGKTIWSHADRPATSIPFVGKIENGRLIGGYINLSLRKGGGKMKLEGEYRIQQWEGTVSLNKIN